MTVPVASIPSPSSGVFHIGPLVDPPVRADAARRDPALRLADERPLARHRRRPRSRAARRGLGRRLRRRRGAALPRHHLVERGADAEVEGRLRGLARRARRLGRDPLRDDRRGDRRAPLGCERDAFMDAAAPGLLLAQGIGRIGNWWNQELFGKPTSLPWGLRIDADHRPLQYLSSPTFHPTFLYELDLGPRRRRAPDLGRPPLADPPAGAVRALRRLLLLRPLLRGAAARRPVAPLRGAAAERVGVGRPLSRRGRLLRLVAGPRSRRRFRPGRGLGETPEATADPRGPEDGRSEGARPEARLACGACPRRPSSASSSSTSTRSRGPSTCCSRSSSATSCR